MSDNAGYLNNNKKTIYLPNLRVSSERVSGSSGSGQISRLFQPPHILKRNKAGWLPLVIFKDRYAQQCMNSTTILHTWQSFDSLVQNQIHHQVISFENSLHCANNEVCHELKTNPSCKKSECQQNAVSHVNQ